MARHVLIAAVVLTAVSVLAPRALAQDSPVVTGNTAFGLALFKRFAERPGNVVCSPFSISTALAMTAAGARGNTLAQMSALLGLDLAADDTHRQLGALLADLDSRITTGAWANDPDAGKKPFELVVANALWGQQDYPFAHSFMAIVSQQYRAGIQAVDFRGASDATRKQINAWVEERTSSRIKDILGPVDLGPDARLVLTNAIYFKAAWAASFHASDTRDQPFHLANGDTPAVPTMHCARHLRAFDAGAVDIVELPYMARAASMLLIIPKATGGLAAIEAQLEPATLTGWLAKLRPLESEDIALALPRFKLTSRFELSPQLQAMGMIDAFKSPAADFTAMSPTGELFIGRVIHEAYVDVDEEELTARFGWANVQVPLSNIASWRIEGPWPWITAIGIRMSIRHADLSFAGSPRGGVRLDFKERVPYGPLRPMPALYVGVEDLEGLAGLLGTHGIPGTDARTDKSPVPPV